MPAGFEGIGKLFIFIGILLILFGVMMAFWGKIPFLGKLPGDIMVQKGNLRVFIPLATSLVLSLVITLIINILFRLRR
ncbi:MAG: DUF2905 domain-containing protein [Candidatus Desantisbacteria bacterium]